MMEPVAAAVRKIICRYTEGHPTKRVLNKGEDVLLVNEVVRLSDAEARIAELERQLKDETERADRMSNDWFKFCEDMGVTLDTQEAVAYEIQADFSNLQHEKEAAEALLKEAGKALEPFAHRCDEAVRPDDMDNDGLTVRVGHLRAARAIHDKIGVKDE